MNSSQSCDESGLERLYIKLVNQKSNAFYCITAGSVSVQREVAAITSSRFPQEETQIIDFSDLGRDFRFSSAAVGEIADKNARILFFVNFQMACGNLSDGVFFQILNLSRDKFAEWPCVLVFLMPLYFRIKIARNAPDFDSFFWYRAEFKAAEEPAGIMEKDFPGEGYSSSDRKVLEYYVETYNNLEDSEGSRAFELLLRILGFNIALRVLHYAELDRFYAEFKKLMPKNLDGQSGAVLEAARILDSQGDYQCALEWYRKALDISEKSPYRQQRQLDASVCNSIGLVNGKMGNYEKALEWHQKALEADEKAQDGSVPSYAATCSNIAAVYSSSGDYGRALEWYKKALAVYGGLAETKNPDAATTCNNIGLVYSKQGDNAMALEWHWQALAIFEKHLDSEPYPDRAVVFGNIALVHTRLGDYVKALEWYKKALEASEKALIEPHPYIETVCFNTAVVHYRLEDYAEALKWFHKALAISEIVLGMPHPDTKLALAGMKAAYIKTGAEEPFEKWLERSSVI
ncbi:MAG: DUF2225 domain-containing protein [Clostridiales bacterium]|nr:DUF2225 domain-containing protein [Clostridiales bacterium]